MIFFLRQNIDNLFKSLGEQYKNTMTGSHGIFALRDIRDAVGTRIREYKGYLSIPNLIIENAPD